MPFLRTLLALARPSRLPTVWSNCLAGWWLGGGGHWSQLPILFSSATLLYLGGAFLNDAFDADYDRLHRPARPIPASGITQQTVWKWGVAFLAVGALPLLWCGPAPATLGLVLVFLIVLGNATHRPLALAPVVDGLCRFFLYVLAASVADRGITGWAIWCGLALALYRAGVGYLWTSDKIAHPARYWPILLVIMPIGLALVMDTEHYRESGLLLSAVLGLWILRCLRQTFWSLEPSVSRTVFGLLAGIVFVDWLATCPGNFAGQAGAAARQISFAFLVLFGLTVLLQRLAPEE